MQTAKHRLQIEKYNNFGMMSFWTPYLNKFSEPAHVEMVKGLLLKMEEFCIVNMNGADYLSGTDQPMMIDIHCYPMMARIIMFENSEWHFAYE